ncbi:MAG: nucleotidyl transferase AbiEii/AbiGii toxin family protein [Ruminococcus flavefaciens]|nr:nucleotidyl transferase AbiEii/AbiGii toxin family protein [Ruminococcus flavefaciens]
MINIANASGDERQILFANTAEKLKMHPAIVEKDFWVCFMLNHLFGESEFSKLFVFKGGTSLSKAYHAIERFSEDIDLILDWRILNYNDNAPYSERSKTQQDKFNKTMNKEAALFYKEKLVPVLMSELNKVLKNDFNIAIDSEDEMVVNFTYPNIFSEGYIRPEIRLEIGPIAEWMPSKKVQIKSFSAECYPNAFKQGTTEILTVEAYRTFWEKATILHKIANMPKEKKLPPRYARHYYDLYCLGNTKIKDEAFANKTMLEKDVAFKEKFYYSKSAGYDTATLKDIRLIPDDFRLAEINEDYEKMINMIYGLKPNFETIIKFIAELEREIHKL